MSQKALEGEVMESEPAEVTRLRAAVDRLTRERDALREENAELQQRLGESDAPIARLREKLEPFYKLLQAMFGDIEEIAPEATVAATPSGNVPDKSSPVWNSWKTRLGATAAKIITALQEHSDLNTQQLAIITGLHRTTIPKGIYDLNKAGLINKSGGRFSLKQL